jgi:tetratricopeptide (TPR) repeat protein
LVEPTTETQVWAATYDRASRELVRVPVDIARDLAVWLAGTLEPTEQAALERRPTQNPEAYEAYLRGNAKFYLRLPEANLTGIADFRRALALDPRFEAARARIAMMQAQQHDYEWYPAGTDPAALLAEALARADSTIERDPALAEGWTARCYALYQGRRLPDALEACDRAVALDPRDLEAHNRRGWVLLDLGRDTAALAEAGRCLEIDAGWHLPYLLLGRVATESGSLAQALAHYDELLRLAPGYMSGHFHRGRVRLLLGDVRGAREDLEALPPGVGAVTLGALLDARSGNLEAARAAAEQLAPWPTYAALVYASLLDSDRALAILESATPPPAWIDLRARELDALRSDPRFERVVAAAALARDRR